MQGQRIGKTNSQTRIAGLQPFKAAPGIAGFKHAVKTVGLCGADCQRTGLCPANLGRAALESCDKEDQCKKKSAFHT